MYFRADRLGSVQSRYINPRKLRTGTLRANRRARSRSTRKEGANPARTGRHRDRQTLALTLRTHRPQVEVRIASPDALDREAERFEPHLVVCNEASQKVRGAVISWVEILIHDSLDANISVGGQDLRVEDITIDYLLGMVDETEELVLGS